jgi:hypothetical protein
MPTQTPPPQKLRNFCLTRQIKRKDQRIPMHTTPQKRLFQHPSEILVHRGGGVYLMEWPTFSKIWIIHIKAWPIYISNAHVRAYDRCPSISIYLRPSLLLRNFLVYGLLWAKCHFPHTVTKYLQAMELQGSLWQVPILFMTETAVEFLIIILMCFPRTSFKKDFNTN